jgi:CRISPR-associated protein Cmr1
LRVPSIRGLLRYWLRAAAGASNPDIGSVREREEATFGSVNHGSPVALWISDAYVPPPIDTRAQIGNTLPSPYDNPLPRGRDQTEYDVPHQTYLFWSMQRDNDWRKSFPAGTEFDLHLASQRERASAGRSGAAFQRALGALWLLTHLGGLGARSRRGAGSISPLEITTQSELPDLVGQLAFTPATSVDDLRERLRTGVEAICTLMRDSGTGPSATPTELPPFDILAGQWCRIWILHPASGAWETSDEALDNLAISLGSYRESIHPVGARAVFGLPIIAPGGASLKGRRASPLLLRISEITPPGADPKYVAVATLFKAQFQPAIPRTVEVALHFELIEQWIEEWIRGSGDLLARRVEL